MGRNQGMKIRESDEQKKIAKWLDSRLVSWFHVPNEAKRGPALAASLKAQGLKAGIPDIIVIQPPPKYPKFCGVVMELKIKPNVPTPAQHEWLSLFFGYGWYVSLVFSADEAIRLFDDLGYCI